MFKIRFNPLRLGPLNAQSASDGYFGWTDRYGLRAAPPTDDWTKRASHQNPFLITND